MYAASNNGISIRAVDPNYTAATEEVLFPDYPTSAQLMAAFSGYTAAATKTAIPGQIAKLEALQTPRLMRDFATGNTMPINNPNSPLNGMTPAAALAYIETKIQILRTQLST